MRGGRHKQVGWAEAWDLGPSAQVGNLSHVIPREKGGHQLEATPVLEAGSAASRHLAGGRCAGSKAGGLTTGPPVPVASRTGNNGVIDPTM